MSETPSETTAAEEFNDYIQGLTKTGEMVELVQVPSVTSLGDLAKKLECDVAALFKTVCLNYKNESGRYLIAVIVPATQKVDINKVAATLGVKEKIKSAQPNFITEKTGFMPGGIPPIGFEAIRLIDKRTFTHQIIFAGGGNNLNSYIRMDPKILKKLYPNARVDDFLID